MNPEPDNNPGTEVHLAEFTLACAKAISGAAAEVEDAFERWGLTGLKAAINEVESNSAQSISLASGAVIKLCEIARPGSDVEEIVRQGAGEMLLDDASHHSDWRIRYDFANYSDASQPQIRERLIEMIGERGAGRLRCENHNDVLMAAAFRLNEVLSPELAAELLGKIETEVSNPQPDLRVVLALGYALGGAAGKGYLDRAQIDTIGKIMDSQAFEGPSWGTRARIGLKCALA